MPQRPIHMTVNGMVLRWRLEAVAAKLLMLPFGADARNINGTVRPDGTFGGTIGFQHLVGKFNEDKFEGAFQSFDCAWTLILKRATGSNERRGLPSPPSTFVAWQVLPLQSIAAGLEVQ